MTLEELASALRDSRGLRQKADLSDVLGALVHAAPANKRQFSQGVMLGDDCAAIPDGDGYLLFAIEGLVDDFVRDMPWFAGYSGVMVNISDIYAMGGRPLAVVDALWSAGGDAAEDLLAGMTAAANAYGVPIVGGHSKTRNPRGQLAVAIVGRAQRLLTSFSARLGDKLLMAVDLRGFEAETPYWNASVGAPPERLRPDLELLAGLAEDSLCDAAKDISMAGAIGTTLMLLEGSRAGAVIDVTRVPRPAGISLLRWLTAFPSYGFVLSVRHALADKVCRRFHERNIACAVVGRVDDAPRVALTDGAQHALMWDFDAAPFIAPPLVEESTHG